MTFVETPGELTMRMVRPDGSSVEEILPTYTCGHCSDIIVLRPDRVRERRKCLSCSRTICEKKQICNAQCTPLHSMARDHFEGAGFWGRLVPAIMAGMSSVDEAEEKGVVIHG